MPNYEGRGGHSPGPSKADPMKMKLPKGPAPGASKPKPAADRVDEASDLLVQARRLIMGGWQDLSWKGPPGWIDDAANWIQQHDRFLGLRPYQVEAD